MHPRQVLSGLLLAGLAIWTVGCSNSATPASDSGISARLYEELSDQRRQTAELREQLQLVQRQLAAVADRMSPAPSAGASSAPSVGTEPTSPPTRPDPIAKLKTELLPSAAKGEEAGKSAQPSAGYKNDRDFQGGGFFLQSPDGDFRLNLEGRAQVRYTAMSFEDARTVNGEPDRTGSNRDLRSDIGIPRMRLNFSGHAFRPEITYQLEADLSSNRRAAGDAGGSGAGDLAAIQNAWVNWNASRSLSDGPSFWSEALQFRAGQYQLPFGRSGVVHAWNRQSEIDTQTVDRLIADQLFRANIGVGADLHGVLGGVPDGLPTDRPGTKGWLEYFLSIHNGFQSAGQRFGLDAGATGAAGRGLDKYPALMARLNLDAVKGRYVGSDGQDYYWFGRTVGDLEQHLTPAWQIGGTVAWQRIRDQNQPADNLALGNVYRLPPQRSQEPGSRVFDATTGRFVGTPLPADEPGSDLIRFGADTAFKWHGFSVQAELYYQFLNGLSNPDGRTANQDQNNLGWYVSSGYFVVPRKWELVTGVSAIHAGSRPFVDGSSSATGRDGGDAWQLTLGTNVYPFSSPKLRLSLDGSYLMNPPFSAANAGYVASAEENAWQLRAQVQVGF